MIPGATGLRLLLSCVVFAALAALYAAGAASLGRRFGTRVLLVTWILVTVLIPTVISLRLRALGPSTGSMGQWTFQMFLLLAAASFGLETLALRRAFRAAAGPVLNAGLVGRAVAAFFAGLAAFLLILLVSDIASLR